MTGSVFADDSTLLVDGVNGTLTAGALTGALPAIDGSALTDVAAVTSNTTVFTARADVNLLMGEVVYLTGISGNTPTIDKAQANAAGTMPAFGIVKEDVNANNTVEVITFGSCPGHDAANFGETGITFGLGDTVYVSATEAGKLTNVAPAGESNLIQNIGKIERATPTTNMTIKVGGAGRTNATPALDQGNIFIGDAQNRSSTMSFATAMSTYGGALTGDVTGSVFADDSTLLVDGTNGTINSSALTKPIELDDAEEVQFGTDNDMRIMHSGISGLIQNTTGTLVIAGPIVRIQDAGSAQSAFSASNGIATLYHLNSTKLETTTDGIAITGKITGLTDPTDAQDAATKAYVDANSGGGGSGLQSRSTATGNTSSLADAAEADLDITGFKSYALLTITTDRAARVRLYVSAATRTADASRAEGVDPTSDAGLIAEVITTGSETVTISPGAYGFNLESTPTTTIPCRVTNKSGGTATVQVTLNILQLEA